MQSCLIRAIVQKFDDNIFVAFFSDGQLEPGASKNSASFLLRESCLEVLPLGFDKVGLLSLWSTKETTFVVILF